MLFPEPAMEPCKGSVHSLETFGLVDGPGVRTVVFVQGCRMRCKYCHNPETWALDQGEIWTAEDLFRRVVRYKNYWGNNGGITVSGGEPLLQMEFVAELFEMAKKQGIHTALDTAGNPYAPDDPEFMKSFQRLMNATDLVLLDLKEMDEPRHKDLTGWTNRNILAMARWISDQGIPLWVRHVLVPGVTDQKEDLEAMRKFLDELKSLERVEILPYHTLGVFKWKNLGIPYPLEHVPVPTKEEEERAKKLLRIESE